MFTDFIFYFFGGLECVGNSFAYVAHFVFFRDAWIRNQRAAVASRRATNFATHLPLPVYIFTAHIVLSASINNF
jgi:hypothetical protein